MKPQKHGSFHQKHSLGQNFIEDEALLSQLAELSLVTAEDCVLEIGPGFGALTKPNDTTVAEWLTYLVDAVEGDKLTKPLAERAKQVVSLEIDRTLIPILNVTLEKYANARVICDDVMRTNLSALVAEAFGADCPSLRVAANLPYYITTDVLTKLMRELPQAKSIAVMIQKEVGDKLLSGPGDDGYGPLAVMCQYRYHVMCALDVPAACFNPPPKVDSSFMVLEKLEQPRVNAGDEEIFTRLVRSAFAMRRKTLLNNLVSGFSLNREQAAACLAAANLSTQARAEELSLEDFAGLAIQLQNTIR